VDVGRPTDDQEIGFGEKLRRRFVHGDELRDLGSTEAFPDRFRYLPGGTEHGFVNDDGSHGNAPPRKLATASVPRAQSGNKGRKTLECRVF
jgi:hypothetical protein